jgi:capsular polysaccharide biosynthesis protein
MITIHPVLMSRLRDLIATKVELDKMTPSRYALMNRKKRQARRIVNFDQVRDELVRLWPSVKWEFVESEKTVLTGAKLFNAFLFFMGTTGAGMANTMFMQPESVVCEVQGRFADMAFVQISQIFRLHHVLCRLPYMPHWSNKGGFLPIELARELVGTAVKVLSAAKKR